MTSVPDRMDFSSSEVEKMRNNIKGFAARAVSKSVAMLSGVVLLSACAGLQEMGKTPEELVRMRAESRWQAIIAGDWESAYSFSTPAFRSAVGLAAFTDRLRGAANRKGVEIRSVTCQQATCDVVLRLVFQPLMPRGHGELTTDMNERWVEVAGRWYVYQRF